MLYTSGVSYLCSLDKRIWEQQIPLSVGQVVSIYLCTWFVLLTIPYFTEQSLGKSLQTFEEFFSLALNNADKFMQ